MQMVTKSINRCRKASVKWATEAKGYDTGIGHMDGVYASVKTEAKRRYRAAEKRYIFEIKMGNLDAEFEQPMPATSWDIY